jgi:hypothetical protein
MVGDLSERPAPTQGITVPSMPLLPRQRDQLVKILGLTGSQYDGEALAAARKAHGILTAAGLSWDTVIAPADADHHPDDGDMASTDAEISWCLDHGDGVLTAWDRQFLVSLQSFSRHSEKQKAVLDRIGRKCRAAQRR